MADLSQMLQSQNDMMNRLNDNTDQEKALAEQRYTAEKSASLQDFIEMIAELVSKSMKKNKVEFIPDEGNMLLYDPNKKIEHPYILYEVIERIPKGEIKPREREIITEEKLSDSDNSTRQGVVSGQRFACQIQFNIIAPCEYKLADKVMNDFEDMMFIYTYYFKRNGVAQLLFKKHFTDSSLSIYRQSMSIRSLQYYVEIEKLISVFDAAIDGISII